ncbi:ABC transporter ATP-binding protein [Zongyangia hominis]|uniref:ABC transporter ATP-binding protein n=1 Tax=Zongyangia hominis TaxID=2763677 RepID=A0A926EBG9_9FIRM|nr:ABC transporter ATP-binding protein [Zongyangia hominis]MBC8569995.1 ABC transporter ATP-binding protein [Zongyangia hominis]
MWKLARYLKHFKKEVILGPFFKLLEAIFELIVPLVMAKIIDVGVKNGDTRYVLTMGGVMVLLGVAGLGFALTCQYFAAKASQGFGTMVRNDLFAHISSLSHGEVDRIGTPSLITRITGDVNQLQVAVAMLIRLVVRAPFLVIGAAVMAMMLDLRLSLVFLAAAPLVGLALYFVMSRSVPFYRVIQKKLDRISLITRENLEGARVIRAFSKQDTERARFHAASEDAMVSSIRVGKIAALLNPLTFAIMNLAIVAIVWFGGFRVDTGALSQGQIIAFVNYMTQILLALVVVANLVIIFTKSSASAARVNEVFATQPSITDPEKALSTKDAAAPKIQFRDVSFSYPGSGEVSLSHISVDIQKGQTVGIIGGTGSGKSTLVNLIPRFYDATEGSILVDGVDVRSYPLEKLRGQIGIVPQQAVLFSGTLEENLRWGKEGATKEQMDKALRVAQAKEFVDRLPDGWDTQIAQGGKNLSGGQRQRLTIARALTREPDILILDDSMSALDFATDAALRRALREETEDMTVLMVTQRAHTIRSADLIIVLDDGEVAGIGTHEALFAQCGVYREICLSQQKEKEAAGQ